MNLLGHIVPILMVFVYREAKVKEVLQGGKDKIQHVVMLPDPFPHPLSTHIPLPFLPRKYLFIPPTPPLNPLTTCPSNQFTWHRLMLSLLSVQ